MIKALPIVLVLLAAAACSAQAQEPLWYRLGAWTIAGGDPWDNWDKVLFAGAIAATAADGVTSHIIMNEGCTEKSPILGEHPSDTRIAAYLAAATVVQYLVAEHLPPPWRKAFLAGMIVLELKCARHNYLTHLGCTARF